VSVYPRTPHFAQLFLAHAEISWERMNLEERGSLSSSLDEVNKLLSSVSLEEVVQSDDTHGGVLEDEEEEQRKRNEEKVCYFRNTLKSN
jgi:hypothetical protein